MAGKERLVIAEKGEIEKKLNRLACQILENHANDSALQFIGLNNRGYQLAQMIVKKISHLDKNTSCALFQGYAEDTIEIEKREELIRTHPIIIVDDVLNTGRSLYHFLSNLSGIEPKQLEICVLAHRHHKQFPIHANYVGLTVATTVQEHIYFDINKPELYLE